MKRYVVEVNNNEYEVLIKEENEIDTNVNSKKGNETQMTSESTQTSDNNKNIDKNTTEPTEKEEKSKNKDKGVDSTGKEAVNAPMSGKILSVRVDEGESVNQNQVLMTIEAMKMETEIVAPVSGKMSDLLVDEGSKCKQGDKLALIQEAGGK